MPAMSAEAAEGADWAAPAVNATGGRRRRCELCLQRWPRSRPGRPAVAPCHCQARLKLDLLGHAFQVMGQTIVVVKAWRKAGARLVSVSPSAWLPAVDPRLLVLLVLAACLAFMLARPNAYCRHRPWFMPAWVVLLLAATPQNRRAGVGPALALERQPRPGAVGAALDVVSLTMGMRVLSWSFRGAFAPLPPTATLALHTGLVLTRWNLAAYCATPLLTAPLSQARQSAAAALLEVMAIPVAAVQLSPVPSVQLSSVLAGTAAPISLCPATVGWLFLFVGLLGPLLLSAWAWRPPAQQERVSSRGGAFGGAGSGACGTTLRRLWRYARAAVAASDRGLAYILGGSTERPVVRVAVAWYLLSDCG